MKYFYVDPSGGVSGVFETVNDCLERIRSCCIGCTPFSSVGCYVIKGFNMNSNRFSFDSVCALYGVYSDGDIVGLNPFVGSVGFNFQIKSLL